MSFLVDHSSEATQCRFPAISKRLRGEKMEKFRSALETQFQVYKDQFL